MALARELGLRELLAYALEDLTFPLISAGRIKDGKDSTTEGMHIWQDLGNLPMLVESYTGQMYSLIIGGEIEQALKLQKEAYEISDRIGNLWKFKNFPQKNIPARRRPAIHTQVNQRISCSTWGLKIASMIRSA